MTVAELIFPAIYLGIAFAISVGLVLGFGVLLHAERRMGQWVIPVIIPVIALAISISTLLSGRDLKFASVSVELIGGGGGGTSVLRMLTIFLLGICIAHIMGLWMRRQKLSSAGGTGLFGAFAFFFLANNLLNSAFGTAPTFIHNLFYPIVLFSAAYVARRESIFEVVAAAKLALIAMMLISLFVAVAKPGLAVQPNYHGWIPGLEIRLWGVGSNANSIGPLALTLLLVEYMQPSRWILARWTVNLLGLAVFILAQSKTVWGAAILVAPLLLWYRMQQDRRGMDVRLMLAVIVLSCTLTITLFIYDPVSVWNKIAMTQAGGEIRSLTGRGQIWTVAINEWMKNPLFGYGPEIWGAEFRQRVALPFAFSAHNQFLQSLSAAGILGLISLVVYLGYLGLGAFRAATETRGASMALFCVILFRCMTETPLMLGTILNGDFLMHFLLFAICLRGELLRPARKETINPGLPVMAR